VSNQLNRLYAKFLKRNPGYDGKVCISRDFHGNEVRDAGHPSEDLIDKGKLVSTLMEEVKSLKAKVKVASTFRLQNKDKAK
ncbi:hypothetical protein B296_00008848, partial [Ensete ventricosum]